MQYVLRGQRGHPAFARRIGVGQLPLPVAIHGHAIRQQWVQPENPAPPAADDLAVAVSVEEQMREHGLAPDEAGHFGVGRIVQEAVERILRRFSAARIGRFIHVQRQASDGFRNDAHAGVDRRDLYGARRRDRLARHAGTEGKRWRSGHGVRRR